MCTCLEDNHRLVWSRGKILNHSLPVKTLCFLIPVSVLSTVIPPRSWEDMPVIGPGRSREVDSTKTKHVAKELRSNLDSSSSTNTLRVKLSLISKSVLIITCTPSTLPSAMAGQAGPSNKAAAVELKPDMPRKGTYSKPLSCKYIMS